jgi:hypothetical protein
MAATAKAQTLAYIGSNPDLREYASSNSLPLYRNAKRLPSTYTGFAIEVAIADYPLDSSDKIFRMFGNIHYDKRPEGWYSYLIPVNFSTKDAAQTFMAEVIREHVPDARLIEYKEGNRKVRH